MLYIRALELICLRTDNFTQFKNLWYGQISQAAFLMGFVSNSILRCSLSEGYKNIYVHFLLYRTSELPVLVTYMCLGPNSDLLNQDIYSER